MKFNDQFNKVINVYIVCILLIGKSKRLDRVLIIIITHVET